MSRRKQPVSPKVIVVPHRPGTLPKGMIAPILVMIVAIVGLTVRAMNPDWRGLMQEAQSRVGSMLAAIPTFSMKPIPSESTLKPKPERDSTLKPKPDLAVIRKPVEPAKPQTPKLWDDIQKDADKAKNDRAKADRIKAQAEEELANAPLPPPLRRNARPNAAAIAAMRRQQEEMMRQMAARMAEHQREFEQMFQGHTELQERLMREFGQTDERWFGRAIPRPPLPGLFGPPLPGMDRMNHALPGQPRIKEESGEDVRNGVRRTWRTRTIIIGSNPFGGG